MIVLDSFLFSIHHQNVLLILITNKILLYYLKYNFTNVAKKAGTRI